MPEAGSCAQSRLSYPFLLAKELDAELANATCGGATTLHTTRAQLPSWPRQLDSVTRDTDLVTVALGYNDFGFYAQAVLPGQDQDLSPFPARIGERVEKVLERVQEAAPDAEVLVVGYPQLVPESGTCPELPLAPEQYPVARDLLVALDDALRDAADAAGAGFVDVMAASEGHDICAAEEAWVAGLHPEPGMGVGFHPFAQWHAAVTELVLEELEG